MKHVRDQYDCVHGIANCIGDASIMKPAHITSEVTRRPIAASSKETSVKHPWTNVTMLCVAQDEYEHTMRTNVKTAFNILKVRPCG